MLNQKGFIPLILIVVILSILAITGGVYYYESDKKQSAQVKTQPPGKSNLELPKSKTDVDFISKQFDKDQKFFESEPYPLEITSIKESELLGMKCSPNLTCTSPYDSCTYSPEGADTSKKPQISTDSKILKLIKEAVKTIDPTTPGSISRQIDEVTSCETTEGYQLLRYKTGGGGGGTGSKENFGIANKDGTFTRISSINERLAYFGCTSPLLLTKDKILYYQCEGGTQGLGGGRSIYKINLNANSSSLLKKCISVLDESSGKNSVFCNDGEIEKHSQHLVSTNILGDRQTISIKKINGEIVTPDVIELNYDAILNNLRKLGLKGSGMIGYALGLGSSESTFVLDIQPADGSMFAVDVDTSTGIIKESTFIKK